MNPMTPTNPGSAMLQGGTFMRPGAVAWGYPEQPGTPESDLTLAATEHALAAAAKDPDRVTDLLDELSRGRLWLPLPDDDRPVTDGSAVLLPTVTYLGAEFVPAFTSAHQLAAWHGRGRPARQVSVPAQQLPDNLPGDVPFAAMPIVRNGARVPLAPNTPGGGEPALSFRFALIASSRSIRWFPDSVISTIDR